MSVCGKMSVCVGGVRLVNSGIFWAACEVRRGRCVLLCPALARKNEINKVSRHCQRDR